MKKLLALLIISALMLSSCSLIDKIVNTDPPSDPTADTTPGADSTPDDTEPSEMTGPEDTTDTEPADTSEPTPDVTEPDEEYTNVFFAADNYTVVDMGDGTYAYVTDNPKSDNLNTAFSDAFTVSYTDADGATVERVILIVEKNGFQTIFSPDADGYLRGYHTAEKFTKYGNFILSGSTIYGADLAKKYTLPTQPLYYTNSGYEITGVSYGDDSININVLREGKKYSYCFWSSLPTVTLPDNAELIAEKKTDAGLMAQIHLYDGKYYYTYDYLTVKVGPAMNEDAFLINDECARFVKIDNGELVVTDFEWCFTKSSLGRSHVGYVVMNANLGKLEEIDTLFPTREYNGAQVFILDPYTYVIKDGEVLHTFDCFRAEFREVGGLLAIGEDYYTPYTVIKPDLTLLSDRQFEQIEELADGNVFARDENGEAAVLDKNGDVLFEFPEQLKVAQIGVNIVRKDDATESVAGEWALVTAEDKSMRLYTPYGEELCNFGVVNEKWRFHFMLSGGYYEKEGYPSGVYFIFEDPNDTDEDYGYRSWEYYYSFETDEYGIIDNGYSSFAYAKPVLYLYPTEKTDVTVTFEHPESLTVDYPKYDNGWRVTAMPDGTLADKNGREYYALYWEESSTTSYYDFVDGFCIKGEDSAAFLEEKLAALGFTDKEANEFIIYWLPILEASEYNLIRFELTDEREASSALNINPAPDSLLRVAMHVKALDTPVNIREQKLPAFERIGFAAVEWGGCIH